MTFWLRLALCLLCGISAAALAAEIRVTDFIGRDVLLHKPAQRIVALSPHIVENVFSAGAGSRLIGAVNFSDYPEQARAIPRVGTYRTWSFETIIDMDPDLILMWDSGNGQSRRLRLEQLGFKVFVSELRTLEDIPRSIRLIGKMAGTEVIGNAEANRLESQIKRLRNKYADNSELSLFYEVWNVPLQTLNGKHIVSDVFRLCGASNVFANEPTLAPKVNKEAVIKIDPDVVLASGMAQERPQWLDEWLDYPNMTAVRNNALLFVPPDYLQRPTARMLYGATLLCEQLQDVRDRLANNADENVSQAQQ